MDGNDNRSSLPVDEDGASAIAISSRDLMMQGSLTSNLMPSMALLHLLRPELFLEFGIVLSVSDVGYGLSEVLVADAQGEVLPSFDWL